MMLAQPKQSMAFPICLLGLLFLIVPISRVWAEPNCNHPEIEKKFTRQFQGINTQIHKLQEILDRKIRNPATPDGEIIVMTRELIAWRAKRDNLAIDYILRRRRDECPPNPDLSPINR
jgi:hypothetical protein